MNWWTKIGGIFDTLFGGGKNQQIDSLNQQNAFLQAQLAQKNSFDVSSLMPIVIIMAIIMLPIMLFKK